MPEIRRAKKVQVPEFIREPFEAAQARFEAFEEEAQKVLKDLMQKRRNELAEIVQRLSTQDWNNELRGRFGKLREQGRERADELRGRAETFRADAVDRLEDLQEKAISFLGVASREQVMELSRELEKLARRLEKGDKAAKGRAKKAPRRKTAGA